MLSGVMVWPLESPVHCEYFSLSALSLGIGQDLLLVPLTDAVSGISKLQYFCRTEQLYCCYILFSQSVFAHTTSAISHYPISDRYLPAHCTAVKFCSVNQFCTYHICHISLPYIWPLPSNPLCCCYILFTQSILHTPHLPYLTVLYLTATFQPTLFNKIR